MPVSRLDTAYRSLVLSKFFTKGWGKPENLKRLFEFRKVISNREKCFQLVSKDYPVIITKEVVSSDNILLEGYFSSPFNRFLPGLLPSASENAYFQILLPKKWQSEQYKPICLHLAGTGDHFFFRRRNLMAKPLLKTAGIGGILLENPFYGMRKPKDQVWSCLHNVSDIFVMGGCLVLESLVLFHWCKRNGFGPLGVTGISMGGHMASLAATSWPEPLTLVPCLSWSTASSVFTRGVMSTAIDWELLEHQYFSDEIYSKEIKHMVHIVPNDTFKAGQHFAKTYPESLQRIHEISSDENIKFGSSPQVTVKPSTKIDLDNEKSTDLVLPNKNPPQSVVADKSAKPVEEKKSDVLREVLLESQSFDLLQNLEQIDKSNKKENDKSSLTDYLVWRNTGSKEYKKLAKEIANEKKEGVKKTKKKLPAPEAQQFMCGIMDECTHLTNFSVPVDTELIIAVAARDDAYVPRDGVVPLTDIWPKSEVRYLNAGHVGAFLLHQKFFRTAIIDGFDKMKKKYYSREQGTV